MRAMWFMAALGAVLLLLAQVGCGLGSSPDEVAVDFWTAVAAGQLDEARALAIEDDPRGLQGLAEQEIQSVEVGEVLTEGDVARVETRLERERGLISFHTRLRRHDQGWRVDSRASRQAYRQAVIEASLADLGDVFSDGAGAIGEVIERGLRDASEAIREALDQLEDERNPSANPEP